MIVDYNTEQFYNHLYAAFKSNVPKLSLNMLSNISLADYGDYWVIKISGPTDSGFDYAQYINEKQSPTKTTRNVGKIWYQWVENTIKETAASYAGSVKYEL